MLFNESQLERYSRHFVLPQIGVSGQKKLLSSKVLVIGAGALGSSALMYLAAAGVGTIGIADFDIVELSNLQRQIIHNTSSVGKRKTISARERIESINPDVCTVLYHERINVDNISEVIRPYDFIIDGTDSFETKFLINDACVLERKPYSHAGAVRFEGQAMTYVPQKGACLRCVLDTVPKTDASCSCSQAGVLGAATGVMGSIQACEAIKYLTNIGEMLTGRLLKFDALDMSFRIINIGQGQKECRLCGQNTSITSIIENRMDYERNDGCVF